MIFCVGGSGGEISRPSLLDMSDENSRRSGSFGGGVSAAVCDSSPNLTPSNQSDKSGATISVHSNINNNNVISKNNDNSSWQERSGGENGHNGNNNVHTPVIQLSNDKKLFYETQL